MVCAKLIEIFSVVMFLFLSSCFSQNTEKVDLMEKAVKAHRSYTNMVSIPSSRAATELRINLLLFYSFNTNKNTLLSQSVI